MKSFSELCWLRFFTEVFSWIHSALGDILQNSNKVIRKMLLEKLNVVVLIHGWNLFTTASLTEILWMDIFCPIFGENRVTYLASFWPRFGYHAGHQRGNVTKWEYCRAFCERYLILIICILYLIFLRLSIWT